MTAPTSMVERLRRRAILERDASRLRRRLGRPSAFAGANRTALFASLTEFPYQLKLEGILATALAADGWQPVMLVPPGSWIPRRYFAAFGLDRLVTLGEHLDGEARAAAEVEGARILHDCRTAADLRALTYRGAAIGRHLLSTISRATHDGNVDPRAPAAHAVLELLLPQTLVATRAAEQLLEQLDPDLVLFLERNYAAEAPLSDLALERGTQVIQYVSGPHDDSLVFKRYTDKTHREHPRSLSSESWQRVRALPWSPERDGELDDELGRRYDRSWALGRRLQSWTTDQREHDVLTRLGLDPQKKTAVVYSHVLWDANMFFGEDLFSDQEEWFRRTLEAACENDRVNWILKLHPANVWKAKSEGHDPTRDEELAIAESVGSLPAHVGVLWPDSDVSTTSVFRLTSWGVTIRGSVGFELPCLGVPVLTAGTGFYAGLGFTVDSATADEYLQRLRRIDEVPPLTDAQVELARRHAHALLRLRPLRFTSFTTTVRPLAETGHPLDHDVQLRVSSHRDLATAPDLRRFVDWATRSRARDYLEEP